MRKVILQPASVEFRGEKYKPTVLKITGRYEDGRPKECTMIHDDQSTDVQEGTEFIIGFLPAKTVTRRHDS
jgi:hypothetical protein